MKGKLGSGDQIRIQGVTVDPNSKPDKKLCSAERHAKIREKEFRLSTIHW